MLMVHTRFSQKLNVALDVSFHSFCYSKCTYALIGERTSPDSTTIILARKCCGVSYISSAAIAELERGTDVHNQMKAEIRSIRSKMNTHICVADIKEMFMKLYSKDF